MKMRKVWAMLTAGAMCFGLMAGCSNDAGTDSQAPDESSRFCRTQEKTC